MNQKEDPEKNPTPEQKRLLHVLDRNAHVIKVGGYDLDTRPVRLPAMEPSDRFKAEVICEGQTRPAARPEYRTVYSIWDCESFGAARHLLGDNILRLASFVTRTNTVVLNFANPFVPGGEYVQAKKSGQEEMLCLKSTLYASLASSDAALFYEHNEACESALLPNCLIYSPTVDVFRNDGLHREQLPFEVSVISQAAPDLRGRAKNVPAKEIHQDMLARMRLMAKTSAEKDKPNLILGAWGCGRNGHDPEKVAQDFHQVFIEEGMGTWFRNIVFTFYGNNAKRNMDAFRTIFRKELNELEHPGS